MPSIEEVQRAYAKLVGTESDLGHMVGYPRSEEDFSRVVQDVRGQLQLKSTDRLLDVGCGNGNLLKQLSAYAGFMTGTDISLELLTVAKKNQPALFLIRALSNHLPFIDNSYHKILCYGVFMFFSNEAYAIETIRELCRVCLPGGLVLIADLPVKQLRRNVVTRWGEFCYRMRVLLRRHPGPSIFNPLKWQYYDLNRLVKYVQSLGHECEIFEPPIKFWVASHRRHLLIRIRK